jgi:hypothetical protein
MTKLGVDIDLAGELLTDEAERFAVAQRPAETIRSVLRLSTRIAPLRPGALLAMWRESHLLSERREPTDFAEEVV